MICNKCNNKDKCGEFFKFLAERDNGCTGFELDEIGPSERRTGNLFRNKIAEMADEGPRTLQDLYLENEIDELANNQD